MLVGAADVSGHGGQADVAERAAAERPEQQARRLTGHSCRLARGQLFSRPQAVETGDPPLLPTPCAALDVAMLAD